MKTYKVEPAQKKSVVEQQSWSKEIDGVKVWLTYEEVWRWGEFLVHMPDTEEEWKQYAEEIAATIEEAKEYYTVPEDLENGIELEDYDFELISTWDGCASYWYASCYPRDAFTEEQLNEIAEEAENGFYEDSYEYLEGEGEWDQQTCEFWIEGEFTFEEVEPGTEYEIT